MGYQVALSFSARRDLQDIVRYISADAPQRAVAFGQFLLTQTKRLSEFPQLGRVVPEIGEDNIREIVVRSYRVIYRVDDADCRVEIVRFWHGARGTPDIGPQ
jgi:plasmid stabilization system protein ParE